jgi:hypothetical protein
MAGTLELRFDQKLNSKPERLPALQFRRWRRRLELRLSLYRRHLAGLRRRRHSLLLSNATQADLPVAAPLSYRAPDNPGRDVRVLFSLTSAIELCPTKASTHCL